MYSNTQNFIDKFVFPQPVQSCNTSADTQALTAALLVAVVDAVIGAVTARPLRNTAVVCLAGELSVLITLVVWTHWTEKKERHGKQVRMVRNRQWVRAEGRGWEDRSIVWKTQYNIINSLRFLLGHGRFYIDYSISLKNVNLCLIKLSALFCHSALLSSITTVSFFCVLITERKSGVAQPLNKTSYLSLLTQQYG